MSDTPHNDAGASPGWLLVASVEETQDHQLLFADCGIIRYRDACELWLLAGTDEDVLTEMSPGVSTSIFSDDFSLETLTGRHFALPPADVASGRDRSNARFELCHENDCELRDCTIEFSARDGDAFLVKLRGTADDIVTGSEDGLDIELDAWFQFNGTQTRKHTLKYYKELPGCSIPVVILGCALGVGISLWKGWFGIWAGLGLGLLFGFFWSYFNFMRWQRAQRIAVLNHGK